MSPLDSRWRVVSAPPLISHQRAKPELDLAESLAADRRV